MSIVCVDFRNLAIQLQADQDEKLRQLRNRINAERRAAPLGSPLGIWDSDDDENAIEEKYESPDAQIQRIEQDLPQIPQAVLELTQSSWLGHGQLQVASAEAAAQPAAIRERADVFTPPPPPEEEPRQPYRRFERPQPDLPDQIWMVLSSEDAPVRQITPQEASTIAMSMPKSIQIMRPMLPADGTSPLLRPSSAPATPLIRMPPPLARHNPNATSLGNPPLPQLPSDNAAIVSASASLQCDQGGQILEVPDVQFLNPVAQQQQQHSYLRSVVDQVAQRERVQGIELGKRRRDDSSDFPDEDDGGGKRHKP